MIACETPFIKVSCVEPQCLQLAAVVLTYIRTIVELCFGWVKVTVPDVWSIKKPIAVKAVKEKRKTVNFVKDLFPTHILYFLQMKKEFFYVKRSVNNMLDN